jgi:bacillithiol biosynthesis cysteine-adding enzyme BshC
VLSQPVASTTQNKFAVDIRRFPWIRRLASDYAFDFGRLADFFSGNPSDPAAWRDAIARSRRYARQRERVASLIRAQQERRGAPPEALAASAQLRDPGAVAIVTGQQAGLFGGPLFTLLKALTALRLADQVRTEQAVPVVPIFWIDAEDHDWDEVRTCGALDTEQTPRTVSLSDLPGADHGPVAGVRLDHSIESAVGELAAMLPTTEFTSDLLNQLRRAYTPGRGMAEAFGRWLESVLGPQGLVVYDASDRDAKMLVADLFAHEVEHPGETARLATEAGSRLVAAGYHAQVTPTPDSVALFHLNNGRHAIHHNGSAFVVGEERLSREDLLARIRQQPETFSPNVLLRPLVQDTLFPTICYVAGPNELAYLAQLREVYAAAGLPMPLMYQRATATIVDSNAMKFLTRHHVAFESLRAQDEAALNDLLQAQLPATVEAAVHDTLRAIEERMAEVAREVTQVDATLEGATRSTLTRMQDDLKKLHAKIIQAAKRKDETLKRQFHHARSLVFPGGHPQEREVGFVYFLNKYGPALVERLGDDLPVDMGQHWVITI